MRLEIRFFAVRIEMVQISVMPAVRNLVVVLGDQLDANALPFSDFDRSKDRVWMAEAATESTHVWSHKQRIALFLSAMRHFRDSLQAEDYPVVYRQLDAPKARNRLSECLEEDLCSLRPERVVVTQPGEWRVLEGLRRVCAAADVELQVCEDTHFYSTLEAFQEHADGRKALRMEFFYREMRKRHEVLMDQGKPLGGEWNYDKSNRKSFGKAGPKKPGRGPGFAPDKITREVMKLVEARFPDHPGELDSFGWAVTQEQARQALQDFIKHRLPVFGDFQDAMWRDEPWLYHSLLSTSLNLKLLNPREAVTAAEEAYHEGKAPLAAVEGFIRQILGWREYVRGIYWLYMPEYKKRNALSASEPLPDFYWTGKTELECLRQSIGQTLEHGYAHHIQRLMVTGLYALLLGVDPQKVHEWYLAIYVDAVEWVELPNTLGMSQYGDGGLMASKPYIATGSYINRMSNYCAECPKDPKKKTGSDACPFTTLYWDFLIRHEKTLRKNNRMSLQVRNLDRLDMAERAEIARGAKKLRTKSV
jgi:deoxyribodipyrimidine photolyase-related protein